MRRVSSLLLVLAPWFIGCKASEAERAAALDCANDDCAGGDNTASSVSSGGSGGSDNSTAGAAGEVTLAGEIVAIDEPHFAVSEGTHPSGNFTVSLPGATGQTVTSTVPYSFTLESVRASESLWVTAVPPSGSDLMTGLAAVDSTTATSVLVPVVRASSLEAVGYSLMSPVALSTTAAQVVLRFVDSTGTAVPDIAVSITGVENIAYDESGSYSDAATTTGEEGLAFLLNVDAAATPSAKVVTLSGAVSTEFAVWVQSGAATALELLVSTD